jgi:hypothetical protein
VNVPVAIFIKGMSFNIKDYWKIIDILEDNLGGSQNINNRYQKSVQHEISEKIIDHYSEQYRTALTTCTAKMNPLRKPISKESAARQIVD